MYILKKLSLFTVALAMLSTVGTAPVRALRLDFQSPDGTTTGSITLDDSLANLEVWRGGYIEYAWLTPTEGPSWIDTAYTPGGIYILRYPDSWQITTPQTSFWYHGTPESNPNPSYPFTHQGHFSLLLNCSLDLLDCLGSSGTLQMSSGTVYRQEWYDGPIVFSGFEYPQEEEVPPNPEPPTSVPEPSSTLGLLLLGGAWLLGRKLQIK